MAKNKFVSVTVNQSVMVIKLNRLEKKNAINQSMYESLCEAFEKAKNENNIHSIVFQSNEGCFSAGNELSEFVVGDHQSIVNFEAPVYKFITALRTFNKPLIAAISGPAVGIGTTMLLHFDMVFADQSAEFCMPFTQLGICAEAGSSFLLSKQVGYHKAAEWLLTGRMISSQEALEFNLINAIVGNVNQYAMDVASNLSQLPLDGVMTTRALMKKAFMDSTMDLEKMINAEWFEVDRLLCQKSVQTTIQSLLNK